MSPLTDLYRDPTVPTHEMRLADAGANTAIGVAHVQLYRAPCPCCGHMIGWRTYLFDGALRIQLSACPFSGPFSDQEELTR